MKKYIMTDQGLRYLSEASPETVTGYIPFSTGTIGQIYLESDIEFVKEWKTKLGNWVSVRYISPIGYPIRTIARLRTPQVSEANMAAIIDLMDKAGLTPIEVIEYLTRNNLKA